MSPPKPLSDMVETRRSSSASKRGGGTGGVFLGERGPVENRRSESVETELGSSDPQAMDAEKPVLTNVPVTEIYHEADVLATPTN
ncbi:hypothetical protein Bca4012_011399 [Brassica carinata]